MTSRLTAHGSALPAVLRTPWGIRRISSSAPCGSSGLRTSRTARSPGRSIGSGPCASSRRPRLRAAEMPRTHVFSPHVGRQYRPRPDMGVWKTPSPGSARRTEHGVKDGYGWCWSVFVRLTVPFSQEFHEQGDRERILDLPLSPLCDLATVLHVSAPNQQSLVLSTSLAHKFIYLDLPTMPHFCRPWLLLMDEQAKFSRQLEDPGMFNIITEIPFKRPGSLCHRERLTDDPTDAQHDVKSNRWMAPPTPGWQRWIKAGMAIHLGV